MERALSAPGKLFVSGEYAVLWGGVSRVAAVGPRTAALVRRRSDSQVHVCVEEGTLSGRTTPRGVKWEREVPPGFSFVARTLDEALRLHGRESVGFDLAVSPSAVDSNGRKLGMGGSACATVLAADAVRFVLEEKFDTLKVALVSHSSFGASQAPSARAMREALKLIRASADTPAARERFLREGDQIDLRADGDGFTVARQPRPDEILAGLRRFRGRLAASDRLDRDKANSR